MIELAFFAGILLGVGGLFAIQSLYKWIADMNRKVHDVKNQLSFYTMERELWAEFHDWKRMDKKIKD